MGYRFRMYVNDTTKDDENSKIAFAYLHWHGAFHSSIPFTIWVMKKLEEDLKNFEFSKHELVRDRELKKIVSRALIMKTTARPQRRDMKKLGFDVSNIGTPIPMSFAERLSFCPMGNESPTFDHQANIALNKNNLESNQWDLEAEIIINIDENYNLTANHIFGIIYEFEKDECNCSDCEEGNYCSDNYKWVDTKFLDSLSNITLEEDDFINIDLNKLKEIYDNAEKYNPDNKDTSLLFSSDKQFFKANNKIYYGY
ncbi:MAG: hypothetical protein R3Y29_03510 [bacterium]